jgi:hypothetical protein
MEYWSIAGKKDITPGLHYSKCKMEAKKANNAIIVANM